MIRPFWNRHGQSVQGIPHIASTNAWVFVAPVVGLLLGRCPAAVSRLIVPVAVGEPVKRMARRRRRAHVTQERSKVFRPSIAHLNSTAAIGGVGRIGNRIAPLFHANPCPVDPSASHLVRGVCRRRYFPGQATARRLPVRSAKVVGLDPCGIPAVTDAMPIRSPSRALRNSRHQSVESLARQIDEV